MIFKPVLELSEAAMNILKKRYFRPWETSWAQVAARIVAWVMRGESDEVAQLTLEMITNRYFIPNSPCIVSAGTENGGLSACFVVDFEDSIDGIYKTKLEFAKIAKGGGGCGTTLSKIRPEGSKVSGSVHGYAGGPIKFFNTICHDMEAMTQAGFREMAMMGTMNVRHPDILKFIHAKETEGRMHTTNISVVVDDEFMKLVENRGKYWTEFGGKQYEELDAQAVFSQIVEGAWRNGEPGLLFYDRINDSPYKYSNQTILATNPCGEQPLPPNGVCNLGSLDISKFLREDRTINLELLDLATRLSIRFLDDVVERSSYPTDDIARWAKDNRPVGLGIMGLADYYLKRGVAYGSDKSIEELKFILKFIKEIAEDESIILGEERGIPSACAKLPVPRRNVTLLSIAPTGTISILAGCNSGIEPIFSEIVIRNDKTGSYQFGNDLVEKDYFRCAVSSNGEKEVTWEEHVNIQAAAQMFVDSGVSKTINFPNHVHRDTIYKAFILAWKLGCKGITVYRNGSRSVEVLSPKNIKRDKCPVCGSDLVSESGCKKCTNSSCGWSLCTT